MCLMKRCGHKNALHAQITSHFCRAKVMQCQLELINQAMIKTGNLMNVTRICVGQKDQENQCRANILEVFLSTVILHQAITN